MPARIRGGLSEIGVMNDPANVGQGLAAPMSAPVFFTWC
jgi:hypothetical protein